MRSDSIEGTSLGVASSWHANKWRLGALLLALLVAAILLVGGDDETPGADTANASMTVTVVEAAPVSWAREFTASGPIVAWQEAIVGSQSDGLRLVDIRADVGDRVAQGQVLVRFDDAMLRAEESQLVAALARAKAAAAQADANKLRALQLRESGGISEQDILRSVTDAEVANADVAGVHAQLRSKRLELTYAEVLAPDDGVISSRTATLGAVVGTGGELFRMIRQGRLEWRAELTAEQLVTTFLGQEIELTLPNQSVELARIRQAAPTLDEATRLGTVYADLLPTSTARAGMYVTGRVQLGDSPALVLPASSLIIRDGKSYVASVNVDVPLATVSMLPVRVGRREGTQWEVLGGVAPDTLVVEQGAGFLDDGDLVRVVTPTSPQAPP